MEAANEAEGLNIVPSPVARLCEDTDWVPGLVDGDIPAEAEDPGEAELDDPNSELTNTGEEEPKVEAVGDEVCELKLSPTEVVINKGNEPEEPDKPAEVDEPDKPAEVDEPEEPEEPAEGDEPEEPAEPAEGDEPEEPAEPAEPAELKDEAKDGKEDVSEVEPDDPESELVDTDDEAPKVEAVSDEVWDCG